MEEKNSPNNPNNTAYKRRDKSKDTNAKGSPIKKPNGLHWQSPIFLVYLSLFCNFLL